MKRDKHNLRIELSAEQYEQFRKAYANTSDLSMTSYARKLLLGKPVRTFYRDRAFDEFTEAAIGFRKDVQIVLQNSGWSEAERSWIKEKIDQIYQLHIKIHDHVRKNKSNEKRPRDTDVQ